MSDEITTDDILDSRDIEKRIDELKDIEGSDCALDSEEIVELAALIAFRDDAQPYCPDWLYGESLIKDSYFETYARELADEIGAALKNPTWPNNCIDWEKAARELQEDYSSAELMGETYWFR